MENPPREPPVLLEQKIYDTSKSKPPPQQVPPAYVPVYNDVGSAIAQIPQFNNMTGPNPVYTQPFQKVYNINLSNPISNFTTINRVFEDILPGDPRTLSFNTIYERMQLKNYMRTLILNSKDGEEISINGGKNSILSYIKLMDINPYSLNKNPFEDLAKNFLLFRAAYPIRYDNQSKSIEISKQAVGLNIRLYNMTIGEVRAETINKNINKFEFDLWREIEFYREIRDNVILKNVSPNFTSLILYKIDSKSELEWNKLSIGKDNISYSNSYKINELHNLKELNTILNKNKISSNSIVNSIVNIFWISNIDNNKNNFWLNIEFQFKNDPLFNLKWIEPTKLEFNKFLNDNKINKYPTLLIEYNGSFRKYIGDYTMNSLSSFINDEILHTNKLDITKSSGHTLLLLTEAPNTNIIKWVTPIYEGFGSQCKMISTGYKSVEVWRAVIFQILYILTVLEEKNIYFRELSLENNFYIKDLFFDQTTTNYWIYNIDGFEYYVPNYGYLVLFDSKYSDINSIINNPDEREFKICSDNLFLNKNGTFATHKHLFLLQLSEILSSNIFTTKLPALGTHTIDPIICTLIDNIDTNKLSYTKIKDMFIDYFKEYLNNRISTSLLISEKEIVNSYYRPELKPGKLLVYRERFDVYKWVMYKKQISSNKHTIIIKNNTNNYCEIDIHQNKLIGFPLNEKINLNNITDTNIIEKFFLGNII